MVLITEKYVNVRNSNFLEQWLVGLNILSCEDFKNILVIHQILRKLPFDMREHFVDDLPNFTRLTILLVNLMIDFEAACNNIRKTSETR